MSETSKDLNENQNPDEKRKKMEEEIEILAEELKELELKDNPLDNYLELEARLIETGVFENSNEVIHGLVEISLELLDNVNENPKKNPQYHEIIKEIFKEDKNITDIKLDLLRKKEFWEKLKTLPPFLKLVGMYRHEPLEIMVKYIKLLKDVRSGKKVLLNEHFAFAPPPTPEKYFSRIVASANEDYVNEYFGKDIALSFEEKKVRQRSNSIISNGYKSIGEGKPKFTKDQLTSQDIKKEIDELEKEVRRDLENIRMLAKNSFSNLLEIQALAMVLKKKFKDSKECSVVLGQIELSDDQKRKFSALTPDRIDGKFSTEGKMSTKKLQRDDVSTTRPLKEDE